MSKRKSSTQTVGLDAKKQKISSTLSRSTRSSRSQAQQRIKEQVADSSASDSSDDDFILPSQPADTGVVVKPVNSFLSDSSSEEEHGDSPAVHKNKATKKRKVTKKYEGSSSESSSEYFEQPRVSNGKSPAADSFEAIEKNILTGVNRLSDSDDSDMEDVKPPEEVIPTHVLFPSLVAKSNENPDVKANKTKSRSKSKSSSHKASSIKTETSSNEVSMLDVSELLALGESQPTKSPEKIKPTTSVTKQEDRKPKRNIKTDHDTLKNKKKTPESSKTSHKKSSKPPVQKKTGREVLSESEDGSDWEEVDHIDLKDVKHAVIPKEGVEVTVQLPDIMRKRKKKEFDMEACIKRRINQVKRENQILVHKVSLLCWVGHGMYVNNILNSPVLMGFALSLIPSQHSYPPKQVDLKYLEKITQWFKKYVIILNEEEPMNKTLQEILEECFQSKKAYNKRILILLFICMLRSLGVKSRLVLSFQPLPLKPTSEDLLSIKKVDEPSTSKTGNSKDNKNKSNAVPEHKKPSTSKKTSVPTKSSMKGPAVKSGKTSKYFPAKEADYNIHNTPENKYKSISEKISTKRDKLTDKKNHSPSKSPSKHIDGKRHSSEPSSSRKSTSSIVTNDKSKSKDSPDKPVSSTRSSRTSLRDKKKTNDNENKVKDSLKHSERPRSKTSPTDSKSSSDVQSRPARSVRACQSSKYKEESSEESGDKNKIYKSKRAKSSSSKKSSQNRPEHSESDFEPEVITIRKSQGRSGIDRKVLSSEEEISQSAGKSSKTKTGVDIWLEVFVEMEEKWICVDVPNGKVHCVSELYSKATSPVRYVIAFGMDSSVRDVTRRYCPQYYTSTRKQRVDADWWESAIKPFYGRRTAYDKEEEEEFDKQLEERPLPSSIGEYKNHPLYVLKRHLLKFEALYPPEAATVGFIRGEAVYSRDCVFTLRSRETWMKEAKIVKPNQEAYKIVKSRPKYDRMTGQMMSDRPLEIFGPWQVEDYIPPPAKDGKVPRNEYGNVELFKPTMLPKGTVHLQVPGLSRVAKKLQIDCAPAMIGFDFHGGSTHPLFDGFVVCEEFKDILMDAFRQEEEEKEKRQEEKRLKRVYGNWRRLINGLLIRESLKRKYSLGLQQEQEEASTSKLVPTANKAAPVKPKANKPRFGRYKGKNKKSKSTSESEPESE